MYNLLIYKIEKPQKISKDLKPKTNLGQPWAKHYNYLTYVIDNGYIITGVTQ